MGQENLPLLELFQTLIADKKLDPASAERLLEEIQEIIEKYYQQ